jgi:hypothetical protein
MVPLKLVVVAEKWRLSVREPDPSRVILRREVAAEPRKPGKGDSRSDAPPPSGFEIVVGRPVSPSAEVTAVGSLFGSPDEAFARRAQEDLPVILDQIRSQLQNLAERRSHPRFRVDFPIRVYPLYPDGVVGSPITGRCRDVSVGGVRFVTPTPVRTERLFVEFPEVTTVAGMAVYVRVIRAWQDGSGEGSMTVARFRTGH